MSQFRVFAEYVVPSVLAYALAGVYAIVDGFFVGHSMGDAGLSAINIAFPVDTLMQSIGNGIGMGGALLWKVRKSALSSSAPFQRQQDLREQDSPIRSFRRSLCSHPPTGRR